MSSPAPRARKLVRNGAAVCLSLLLLLPLVAPVRPAVANLEDSPAQSAALHRWGAVTLFHGLPSDRVRAVAQGPDGAMWFGTDAGLARYDGRRTQTVTDEGLASRRITALRFDDEGALWVGTDEGAYRRAPDGAFKLIEATKGSAVAAVAAPSRGRAVIATADGLLLDCRRQADDSFAVEQLSERLTPAQPAQTSASSASARPAFELTSLAVSGGRVYVGTRGRGLLVVEAGAAREVAGRPRPFYVETVEQDAEGRIFFGARAAASEGGLFAVEERAEAAGRARAEGGARVEGARDDAAAAPRAVPVAGATGAVTALRFDAGGDLYAGTDGQGVFRLRGAERAEHFTFASTAGGLRSDRVYTIFVDREGVTWFGTDRGVCRYDPRGLRVETVSTETEANFVRSLFRTSRGRLLAGTSRGLYLRARDSASWRLMDALGRKAVYSIAEDARGCVLVGTSAGLFSGRQSARAGDAGSIQFAPDARPKEKPAEEGDGAPSQGADKTGGAEGAGAQPTPAAQQTPPAGEAPVKEKTVGAAGVEKSAGEEKAGAKAEEERRPLAAPVVPGAVRAVAFFGGAAYVAVYGRGVERLDEDFRRTSVWPGEGAEAPLREVISLHADEARGRLWIGTAASGLFYFDGAGVHADPALAPLASSAVRGVAAGSDGLLWLATSRGLYAHRQGGELLEVAPGVDARGVVAVDAPAQGGAGQHSGMPPAQVWCATAGAGVLKVAFEERFGFVTARLDAEQGLPSQNALTVMPLADEEGADAARAEGVSPPSGLTLVVGTSRGLARYEPGTTRPVLVPVRLTASRPLPLEDLEAVDREGARGLRLDYPQTGLVLDVAATSSRTFPEQFQYGFLLYDEAGRVIKRKLSHDSQFGVENLKPGRYRVAAHAFTADLVASDPFTFDFHIERAPFPWTTTALSVLLALALVALMWGYFQHRRIVRAGAELLDANRQLAAAKLQLANEAESERRRIARDLHDQTLADLRRLLLLTDEIPTGERRAAGKDSAAGAALAPQGAEARGGAPAPGNGSKAADPALLRAEIESISQEIRRICEDLSPSVLENVGFAAALEWAIAERVSHLRPECRFTYEFVCEDHLEERLHFAPGVQMQVYRIVQEAVSNICRHAAARHVRLSVEATQAGDFLLTLEDDGRGFDPDNKRALKGRGLAGIRARASMIDATVKWERRHAETGGGMRFTLRRSASAPPKGAPLTDSIRAGG